MKVAIVHDWLTNLGGAERVVLELSKIYPDAPIYTSVYDKNSLPQFKDKDVRTTWLQKLPFFKFKHQLWAPLRPLAFRSLNLSEFDLVISSSSAESKQVKVPNGLHVCYCHTPIRYYWVNPDQYLKNTGFGKLGDLIIPIVAPILFKYLKKSDFKAAKRIDYFIANSTAVKERIKDIYQRDSEVIFPPVDIKRFSNLSSKKKDGFLIVGRQVPYKRFDLAVQACVELGLKLTVVGDGPEHQKLVEMADDNIKFVVNPDDDEITKYFAESKAFIFPGEEDFGIVPVEAMAAGLPVIAFGKGGARDYVVQGETGDFFDEQTVESLKELLVGFDAGDYDSSEITKHVEKFSNEKFHQNIKDFISKVSS